MRARSPLRPFFLFTLKQFQGPLLHIRQLVQRRRSVGQLDEPGTECQHRLGVQGARLEVPGGEEESGERDGFDPIE